MYAGLCTHTAIFWMNEIQGRTPVDLGRQQPKQSLRFLRDVGRNEVGSAKESRHE